MKPLLIVTFACAMASAIGGVVVSLTRERQLHSAPAPVSASDSSAPRTSPTTTLKQDDHPAKPFPNLPVKQSAPVEKVSIAMDETVVKNLIAGVRVASAKGDDATRKALLNGLRKESPTAQRLIQEELGSTSDAKTKDILNAILDDLKGEAPEIKLQ